jgi:hypothetical protein
MPVANTNLLQSAVLESSAGFSSGEISAPTHGLRSGIAGSVLLHALAAFLIVLQLRAWQIPPFAPVVPVDLVVMDTETSPSAPPPRQTTAPQRQGSPLAQRPRAIPAPPPPVPQPQLASVVPPTGIVPPVAEPKPDALQEKLQALAMLRQPGSDARLPQGAGGSGQGATNGNGPDPYNAYSVRDYVRAQVERRWSLDLAALGGRDISIAIRVVLHRDGTVEKAEIVDDRRYRTDPAYRTIALSARNAVLLSSPLSLPAGDYDAVMDMTLNLNPRDTLR